MLGRMKHTLGWPPSAKTKASALSKNGYNSCLKYTKQYLLEGTEELLGKLGLEQRDSREGRNLERRTGILHLIFPLVKQHLPTLSTGHEAKDQAMDAGRRGREGNRIFGNLGIWREKLESYESGMPVRRVGGTSSMTLDLFSQIPMLPE